MNLYELTFLGTMIFSIWCGINILLHMISFSLESEGIRNFVIIERVIRTIGIAVTLIFLGSFITLFLVYFLGISC